MGFFKRFFTQPNKKYRNFQIIFTILTLNFAIPSLSYAFAPHIAIDQFAQLNANLGGTQYNAEFEMNSRFWYFLGTANVMTLAFMCFLLQYNLRRFFPVLIPLTFMKAMAATLWLSGFIRAPEYPGCMAAAILDYVTSAAFVYFSVTALRQIADQPDDVLVPMPRGAAK
jgi:hypothetical protein